MLLYKGTKPYMALQFLLHAIVAQSDKNFPDNTDNIAKDPVFNEQYQEIVMCMWNQQADETTFKLPSGVRISVSQCDSSAENSQLLHYINGLWTLMIPEQKMPEGSRTGVYEAGVRIKANDGFWNRVNDHPKFVNTFMDVKCEIHLDIGADLGPITQPKPPPVHWAVALWRDFHDVFSQG